mgnify:CR=1 FL=1
MSITVSSKTLQTFFHPPDPFLQHSALAAEVEADEALTGPSKIAA